MPRAYGNAKVFPRRKARVVAFLLGLASCQSQPVRPSVRFTAPPPSCVSNDVDYVASICPPPGTYWDCSDLAPGRVCLAAPTDTMHGSCDCTNPRFLVCSVSFPDENAGGVMVQRNAHTPHHCASLVLPTAVPTPPIVSACDTNHDGTVSISEVLQSGHSFLVGCP